MPAGSPTPFTHAGRFTHVEEGAYAAKLLQVKKLGKQTNVIEVACERGSLNHGDAFILDSGANIYVWRGDECSPFEAQMANSAAYACTATGRVSPRRAPDLA